MADFNFYINRQGIQGRKGDKGETGFSPVISVGTDTPNEYKLIIANESNSFETPNLRGNINVLDNGGTYLRYDAETQQISAQGLDAATSTNVGGVLMSTDADIEGMGDGSVITPADLADALPIYLQGEGAVTITQDEETSKTKINVDLSSVEDLQSRVSAAEAEIVGIQADVADLDADNTDNKAIIDAHTNSIADINDSIASLQQTKQAKLTAGEGITIDSNNVISSTGGGGAGDVTAAGDNTFTGSNHFTKQVSLGGGALLRDAIPIEFGTFTRTGSSVVNRGTIQNEYTELNPVYPSGDESYILANTLKINGGYNLILDAGYVKDQDPMTLEDYTYKGKILDGDGNVILSQGNVTAGEGVTINKTTNGIEIVVDNSGGGSIDTSNLVTIDTDQTITGKKTFSVEGESRPNTLNIIPHINDWKDDITNSFSIKGTDSYSEFLGVSCNKYGSYPYNVQTVVDFTSDLKFVGYRGGSTVSFGTSAWQTRPQTYTTGNGANGYKPLLHFGNITAGEGISITDNGENGITLSASGGGSGSAPENMVTTDTDQTITATKIINGSQIKFYKETGATYNGALYNYSSDNFVLECQNTNGNIPESIILGAQGSGSNYSRRGVFLSHPTDEAVYIGYPNYACKIQGVYDLKLWGGYAQNSYLTLSNDSMTYTKADGTTIDLLAGGASAASVASETGGVTGDLKDSTGTAIAKVENGIITEFYF